MKTKHILTAMVLPAMLAACTADEIVENNNVANIQGRALLNPMTITVNGAESRAIWSDQGYGKFVWDAENDKFSAFMLDVNEDPTNGNFVTAPTKDQLLTNYLYASEDGISYTTTSQMVEGAYWFYAPGREKNTRDLIPFKIETAQTYNYYKESADVQAFFTPIYNLTATDSPSSLDLSLTPYFGRAVVTVKNNTKEAFTLNQIVLSASNDAFVYEGNISVKAIQSKGLVKSYIADCEEWHYEGHGVTSTTAAAEKAEKYEARDEAMETAKLTADLVAVDDAKKATNMLVLDLTSEEGYLAVGETREYTLVVPRTETISCTVTLIADKGVKTISNEIQSNYKYGIQFKHNGIMPMFGMNGAAYKAYSVNSFDKIGDNVYYVTSYAQLMNLINTVNGTFTVYNIGDWGIDAAMAETIAKESDVHVIFKNAIYVTADAQSRTAEEDAIVLKKVTFLGGLTVKEDTEVELAAADYKESTEVTLSAVNNGITVEEGATLKVSAGTINGGIEIAEDATVNLAAGTINGTIENEGTLNVAEAAVVANAINTYGTLNLTDNAPVVVVKEGDVTYKTAKTAGWASLTNEKLTLPGATDKVNATVTIDSKVTMTVNADMTAQKVIDGTTTYLTSIVNNGEIIIADKMLKVKGSLVNNSAAKIVGSEGNSSLLIEGTATNDGTANVKWIGVEKGATLTNNGTWYSGSNNSRNNGTIILGANSKTRIDTFDANEVKGKINNDVLSKNLILSDVAKANNVVYYTFTAAVNSADVNALNCADYSLNKVIFNETLTINEDADYATADCNGIHGLRGIKTIEFVKGLVIEAEVKNQVLAATITDIIINGTDVKFEGSNWLGAEGDKVCAIGTQGQKFTIKEGKKLTIVDMTLGQVGETGATTFVSEDGESATLAAGQVVNNGNVYTGKAGYEYKTANEAWWTGAAAQKGFFTANKTTIQK